MNSREKAQCRVFDWRASLFLSPSISVSAHLGIPPQGWEEVWIALFLISNIPFPLYYRWTWFILFHILLRETHWKGTHDCKMKRRPAVRCFRDISSLLFYEDFKINVSHGIIQLEWGMLLFHEFRCLKDTSPFPWHLVFPALDFGLTQLVLICVCDFLQKT